MQSISYQSHAPYVVFAPIMMEDISQILGPREMLRQPNSAELSLKHDLNNDSFEGFLSCHSYHRFFRRASHARIFLYHRNSGIQDFLLV